MLRQAVQAATPTELNSSDLNVMKQITKANSSLPHRMKLKKYIYNNKKKGIQTLRRKTTKLAFKQTLN